MHKLQRRAANAVLTASTMLVLIACGGQVREALNNTFSGYDPVTVFGTVILNQAVKGAVVCVDINANNTCDPSEPVSAATGTDSAGVFSLTFDSNVIARAQVSAAPLVAMIPATAVDATDPASTVGISFALSAPAGKSSQINPLTTLVQAGVASGLSLTRSEAAVAVQLAIPVADIYNYQANASQPGMVLGNARDMASVVALTLMGGTPLSVIDLGATQDAVRQLAQFNFTDVNNYYTREFTTTDVGATGKRQTIDQRRQLAAGTAVAESVLYASSYLTPSGWVRCDASGFSGTRGVPSRSDFCGGGLPSVNVRITTDIAGKAMADVVTAIQTDSRGGSSLNMDARQLATRTFPAGSTMIALGGLNIGQAIYINNLNSSNEVGVAGGAKTLEDFITVRRNTALNLATGSGMSYAGSATDSNHYLMAAFTDATRGVQYYSCTFDAATTAINNCVESNKGTFAIRTVNNVRVLEFFGQPAAPDTQKFWVGYAEYSGGVARVRINKTDVTSAKTYSQRLAGTAGDALKAAVGL